jgi:hypothetical protein
MAHRLHKRLAMRNALIDVLPALATVAPSLFVLALTTLVLANNLSGLARVRLPGAVLP